MPSRSMPTTLVLPPRPAPASASATPTAMSSFAHHAVDLREALHQVLEHLDRRQAR